MTHPLAEDLDDVLAATSPLWDDLRGQRLFITGGTGFFGCWLLETFAWINQRLNLKAQAIVLTRDPHGFCRQWPSLNRLLAREEAIQLYQGDVRDFVFPSGEFTHVIHAATDASASLNAERPAVMLDTIVQGTARCLEFAKSSGVHKFLLTSSGAVYGTQPPTIEHVAETYIGGPDPLAAGSAYGEGKRMAELQCVLASRSGAFEAKIARCFAFVGPYMKLDQHFAIGNFISDVLHQRPIVVKGDGSPYRSYLYAADLMTWLWTILFRGESGRAYNVGSEEAIDIANLARSVAEHGEAQTRVEILGKRDPQAGPPPRYVPSTQRARTELQVAQSTSLNDAIARTLRWFQATRAEETAQTSQGDQNWRKTSDRREHSMMKVSDYVMQRLADWGTRHIFLLTGGGAMHLNDSIAKESRLHYVCTHHEQAAAMAAECYARIAGTPGVLNVTTGPGAINALNGVFGAWTDSIPMIVISGQVKRETCKAVTGFDYLRQLGDQEVDIISMVRGITKYAVLVEDPGMIRYHLERAYYLASHGRPGPCWLDIPTDVQGAQVDEQALRAYSPEVEETESGKDRLEWPKEDVERLCAEVIERIRSAQRPVVMAGTGVRLAGALDEFEEVIRLLQIPVTTAWTHDLIASDDPLFCGRPGTIGERAGNFTVQNSDVLLVLGSRLNIRQVSYNWKSFAPGAYKIQVDVDAGELRKPTVQPDLPVHCDLKVFLAELIRQLRQNNHQPRHREWLTWCGERVGRYPVVQPRQRQAGPPLNPYYFMELLQELLYEDDAVICGNATACIMPFQALLLKKGQRLISNSGSASMGYDLPAAIGAAFARDGRRVICLAGDGSIQLNIQELQTVAHHRLPLKIFVLNNRGYLSIRSTQANFFGRMIGESPESGVSFPDMGRIAAAYGIQSLHVDRVGQMDELRRRMESSGPLLIDVVLDPAQGFEPRIKSRQRADGTIESPALEDMYPFLEPEELAANMVTKVAK
ncbi:MAG TPA: thiamine pyrophosphate-binding protein [Candidatus Angelobacter sp.]|nr:thiamine pyrophosphate-binding protein [Candidatus Angelobacter sp.]